MVQQVVMSPGLAGRRGMNGGSGTTVGDSSGSNLNGTMTNGPTWGSGGPIWYEKATSWTEIV